MCIAIFENNALSRIPSAGKAGKAKCKNGIRNLEKALDKTGKVGYTNQAVSGKRKQISGCSAVLVARLNGVQEAVSSILATRTINPTISR
jgi:hypothetical protein